MGRQSKDRARFFSKVPGYKTRKQTQFATAEIKIGNPGEKKKKFHQEGIQILDQMPNIGPEK